MKKLHELRDFKTVDDMQSDPTGTSNEENPECLANSLGVVLVVDQSEGVRWSLREAFMMRNVTTILTKSVWASKAAFQHYNFTAVLSGMMLPDGSGLDVLSAAKEAMPNVPVFLMSGIPHNEEALKERGAAAFFSKPFCITQALDTIMQVCDSTGT